ncbi:hypothetical protein JCM33374_g684 [Metschnikowia sp. JCM 33374]|nr:hypothetical protein JCM33374_g684 [Metschnikowia sp. JCM 33374]
MISSGALISKYFSEEQKSQLAIAISEKLQENAQDSPVLAELISHLSPDTFDQVYPKIYNFILHTIDSGDEKLFGYSIEFLKSSSRLLSDTWAAVLLKLRANMESPYNFVSEFQKHTDVNYSQTSSNKADLLGSEDLGPKESLVSLFGFLSRIYTTDGFTQPSDSIIADKLICLYLGHRDDSIASACSQLVRWRVDSIVEQCLASKSSAEYYWTLVFDLKASSASKKHTTNAFVLWLRMLGSTSADFKSNDYFQNNVINKGSYWHILQSNLVGNSHETRKLCLSILQLSLKNINCSFSMDIMSWDFSQESKLLREWSRFTTLFEVLGIDTSLHQTQAAVNDIIGIISEESLIHPSWGFCLLSTGFRASMDSVRRYSTEILFSIKPQNLHLLKHGLSFLEEHFLPYLMLSRHFVVRSKGTSSTEIHCEYGEQFSSFICSIMQSLSKPEEFSDVSYTILSVLAKARETFDAVRIYTCYGLVQGLKGKKVLEFGKHDSLLIKLFDNFSEGELFKTAIQTLNLRLILNFRLESLSQVGGLLSKFNSFNGYEFFTENISLFSSYLSESGFNFKDLMKYSESGISDDEVVIFVKLASIAKDKDEKYWSDSISKCSDVVIAKVLESGLSPITLSLKSRAIDVFSAACEGTVSETIYDSLSAIPENFELEFSAKRGSLWGQIQNDFTSADYGTLCLAYAKLKFLNTTNEVFGFDGDNITLSSILDIHKNILVNSAECFKQVSNFYKLKENVFGEYHRLLSIYVDQIGLKRGEFGKVLLVLSFETSHFTTLLAIGKLLKKSFTHGYIEEGNKLAVVTGLSESVAEMDAERFKLSEKELHVLLIEVFFHENVLKSAVSDKTLMDHVHKFAEVIISNSYGRRGLMTTLTKALSDFQINHNEEFEKLEFLPQLLVKAMIHRELQASAFKIERIVGDLYDREIALTSNSHIYSHVYGVDEVAYKVWLLTILNSIRSSSCAQAILDVVFDENDPYNFFEVIKPTDGAEEYVRIQLAKMIVSVVDKVDFDLSVERYFHIFVRFVENDPSPLVRVYFEWVLAQHLLKKPELSESIFQRLVDSLATHELKPMLVTLYERVLFLMIQAMDHANETKFLTKLITIIVPAASTNKAVTRHFSMSLAISIHEEIRKKNLDIDENLSVVIDNMYKSALATDAFGQYRSGDACLWNIFGDLDLVHISGGLLLRLYDRDVDFIVKSDFLKYLSQEQTEFLTHPIGEDKSDLWVRKLKDNSKPKSALQESSEGISSSLQTKSGAWSTVMDVDAKTQISDIKRSELIVVASLVDKPPNLGGICRLCDVLGAGLLTLHDLAIKDHQQFKSVAVTADYWMPMTEVKPDGIVKYLREKKAEGYTLIGLEQTDNSVVLDSELKFPAKSLILLGREKEGVPGELLAELDMCVEIKQVGVVRSMNIQTATAVIVHAYSSQNC